MHTSDTPVILSQKRIVRASYVVSFVFDCSPPGRSANFAKSVHPSLATNFFFTTILLASVRGRSRETVSTKRANEITQFAVCFRSSETSVRSPCLPTFNVRLNTFHELGFPRYRIYDPFRRLILFSLRSFSPVIYVHSTNRSAKLPRRERHLITVYRQLELSRGSPFHPFVTVSNSIMEVPAS